MANQFISKKLKLAREAAGFKQKDIYEWIGVGQSTFSAWETGLGEPNVETFLKLCQKYQIRDIAGYFIPDPETGRTAKQLDPVIVDKLMSLSKRSRDAVLNCLEYEYNNSPLRIHRTNRVVKIPFYPQVATAGRGSYLDDQFAEIQELPAPDGADYAIRISGNSMEPLIHDGDIVYVREQNILGQGEIGIFSYNGESFCKMWDNRSGVPRLVSMNSAYPPITLKKSDDLFVLGKVII